MPAGSRQLTQKKIVIVGGGQAGGRVAQALAGDPGRFAVTLVCREPHPPYERPPLSKGVLLGTIGLERCLQWPSGDAAWSAVDLRLGLSATAIDRPARRLQLSDGSRLPYDVLVLATGSGLRRLSVPDSDLQGIHGLRTIDDALAIAGQFRKGSRLVVVGGGFIGLETAAAARSAGLEASVVEASDRLLARLVPPAIGQLLARRHRAAGVDLHMGTMVEQFVGNGRGRVKAVALSSGEMLPCDLAVVGVGAKAETGLAADAGLEVDGGGVRVDARLRTGDPAIFACGDLAAFWHPLYERHVRVEAWQNAEDQARVVAAAIRGEDARYDTVPWFWSDQYELSLQIAGLPQLGSGAVQRRSPDGAVIQFHLDPAGRLVGATGLGRAEAIGRDIRLARQLIAERAHPAPAALRDPESRLKELLEGRGPAGAAAKRRRSLSREGRVPDSR
jgi:3-phenylpropionate/trans-cinnamate dioxygenase ferredoxin reductase subunit